MISPPVKTVDGLTVVTYEALASYPPRNCSALPPGFARPWSASGSWHPAGSRYGVYPTLSAGTDSDEVNVSGTAAHSDRWGTDQRILLVKMTAQMAVTMLAMVLAFTQSKFMSLPSFPSSWPVHTFPCRLVERPEPDRVFGIDGGLIANPGIGWRRVHVGVFLQ